MIWEEAKEAGTNHRDNKKVFIKSLLIEKYKCFKTVDDFTDLIDKKAKEINLKSKERTELILEAKKEFVE